MDVADHIDLEEVQRLAHERLSRWQRIRLYMGGADAIIRFTNEVESNYWQHRAEEAESRLAAQRTAISEASYFLDPNQGEPQNPSLAYQWLRTTFPVDHPNYVDPAALERQRDGQRDDESPFPFDESNIVERS